MRKSRRKIPLFWGWKRGSTEFHVIYYKKKAPPISNFVAIAAEINPVNWDTNVRPKYNRYHIPASDRYLVASLGQSAYEMIKSLCDPELPSKKWYVDLKRLSNSHCVCHTSVFKERREFHLARQEVAFAVATAEYETCHRNCLPYLRPLCGTQK